MNIFKKKPAKKIIARRSRQLRYWYQKLWNLEDYIESLDEKFKQPQKSAAGRDFLLKEIEDCEIERCRIADKIQAVRRWFKIYSPTTEL